MSGKVFISYRRSEDSHVVGRLGDRIRRDYPAAEIFVDTDAMPVGTPIPAVLDARIRASDVVLVVIGPRWLSLVGNNNLRRLDDPADFVRQEVAAALSHQRPVVPVLIDGAKMPSAQDLPDNIVGLAVAPGLPLRAEDFGPDATRLLARLEPLIKHGSIAVDCWPPSQTQRRWLVPGGGEVFTDFEGGPEMVVVR